MKSPFNDSMGQRAYQPLELRERHGEMLRLAAQGLAPGQIARALGVTSVTVGNILNSEIGRQRLAELQGVRDLEAMDVAVTIRETAPEAARLLRDIVNGETELPPTLALRAKCAESALDRAGFSAVRKVAAQVEHSGGIGLELIRKRAKELGLDVIINVEADEVPVDA